MLRPLKLLWTDPTLRMAAGALALFGCLAASIAPYQSLLAIRIFGLSDGAYAIVLIVAAVVSVLGAVGAGILADQTATRKRVALISALLIVLGNGLVMALPDKLTFVLVHSVVLPLSGAIMGQIFALARLACSRYPVGDRDATLAALRALFAVPFVVVLPLWSLAFGAGASLLAIYAVLVVVGGALVLLIALAWPADGRTAWEDVPSGLSLAASLREMGSGAVMLRVLLSGGLKSGVFVYMVVLGLVFDESTGRDIGDVALFAGLVAGLEVPVMLSMGALLQRVSRLQAILLGTVLYAGFLCAFPLLLATPWVWALVLPAAFGGAIVLSLPLAYVQDLMGARAGAGGALLAVQQVAGDGLGAGVFAIAALLSGYGLAAVLGGVTMLASAFALLWLDGRPQARLGLGEP
ncbi:MFS transporter [Roseisalinus antarcticus]|uniref:Major Facilitator Superfamily protein n=1 Tax=Roseisalinus antarcticus TaxID=254357 RepID=A0A1Y5RQ75_9RHOB|nr:MFS transporter [Roseisalinus antarcticus]SLN22757.1 Major Facilitator Superfamily protein [Roseisalinus antarcticus]